MNTSGKFHHGYAAVFTVVLTFFFTGNAFAQDKDLVVRIAKLQIDRAQLEKYKAALKEEIETSVKVEAGVLTLHAMYEKADPTRITILEIYANEDAYKAHLQTSHFKKYKTITKDMVTSLELVESVPITLQAKTKIW